MSNRKHGKKGEIALQVLKIMGMFDIVPRIFSNTLTVLNYHRIDDPQVNGGMTFKPNISATPKMFDLQMEYLARKYNVISATEVVEWINGRGQLPHRSALITFDDGYYDNYKSAFPILGSRKLPAIIFLTSDYIGKTNPFYWDLIAYCLYKTENDFLDIPSLGCFRWSDDIESKEIIIRQIVERIKPLREEDKLKVTESIPELSGVSIPTNAFDGMFLSWSDVREMRENGIEMGAHTASHPILTKISPAKAKAEIVKSIKRIEGEIGRSIHSFAYPNGQSTDFDTNVIMSVKESGLQAAYTLLPGPTWLNTVKNKPFQIRRIFLSHKDSFSKFLGKLSGITRFG